MRRSSLWLALALVAFVPLAAAQDFVGPEPWWWDGEARPLWRHHQTGLPVTWVRSDGVVAHRVFLDPNGETDALLRFVGYGDFSGDGREDILWHSPKVGLLVWELGGGGKAVSVPIASPMPPANWRPVGVGDFDRDGKPDIAWWNLDSGKAVVWLMSGVNKRAGSFTSPDGTGEATAQLVGVADMTADGWPDLLWRRANADLELWTMEGLTRQVVAPLSPAQPRDGNWWPVGLLDVNGDSQPDVLWRNQDSLSVVVWLMDGLVRSRGLFVGPRTDIPVP